MKKRITSLVGIKANDPAKEIKFKMIEGVNRISDLINLLNRDMENRFLIVFSIIISGAIGFLIAKGEFTIVPIIFLILLVPLGLSLIKEQKEKNKLYEELELLIKHAKKMGLDLDFRKKKIIEESLK